MSGKKKKFTNYIVIQPWMFSNLKLSGNEAIVFAIVYGFSQDGKSWYRGGSYYIEQTTPFTQRTAKTHLWTLEKMGVIEMQKEIVNGVERNIYRATPGVEEMIFPDRNPARGKTDDPGKNFTRENFSPVKNTSENPGKIFTQTREKFSRKKSIEKSIGKSIYQREAPKRDGLMDSETVVDETRERFREQLELDTLALRYDSDMLEEILENIVEMYCCPNFTQKIGQYPQTTKGVRLQLDKLEAKHIEYLMESMASTTQPIKNPKAYLQTAIFNARSTFEHHCQFGANAIMANPCRPSPEFALTAEEIHRRLKKRGDGA